MSGILYYSSRLPLRTLNRINCCNIPSLTMSAKSSTMYAHYRMHSWKSAISLSWMVCAFQPWARF